jgi:hypothetical protein
MRARSEASTRMSAKSVKVDLPAGVDIEIKL